MSSQSLSQIYVHLVFSTKGRVPILRDESIREELHRYLAGGSSVSPSHVRPLVVYIANQLEHHRTESFQVDLRRLLDKYGVEYDEWYLWD